MKLLFYKYSFAILFATLLFSCSDERVISVNPGKHARASFQLTETDENTVSVIDILAFKVDDNDNSKEYFAYSVKSNKITDIESSNRKSFTVPLLKGGDTKYRFVVLANAEAEVDGLGDISTSTLKEDVMKQLTTIHSDKWITDNQNSNYRNIPMWAETPQMVVNDNTHSITGLHLIRMLSRVDVTVDPAIQSIFKMNNIRVYNYNTHGNIVPSTEASYWDGGKALKPTIPDQPGKDKGPLVYDQMSTPGIASNREIYLFESVGLSEEESGNALCLIIGGEFNNEGKDSYYKVNFRNANKNIDLLRNYLYNVKIKDIQSTGYNTPDEAFLAKAINLTSEIAIWDQGELTDIVSNEQYFLGVSKKQFSFSMDQHSDTDPEFQLVVATDDPNGWSIEKITDAGNNPISWLTTSPNSGSANIKTTMDLFVQENITGFERIGFIHIKSGRLSQVIEVHQSNIPEIGLFIVDKNGNEITELVFGSHVGEVPPIQDFSVKWLPKTAENKVTVSSIAGFANFDFGSRDVITSSSIVVPSGEKSYSIQPTSMTQEEIDANPFLEKALRVDYTINNGVTYESKTLFLTQKNFAAVPTVDANFVMDGTEQYFTINANAPWKIEVNNDPLNIIQELITTTGGAFEDKRTEKVYFKTNDYNPNPDIIEGEVSFTIKSTNAQRPFADKTVTIKCFSGEVLVASNCYALPSLNTLLKGYLIPVSRANEAFPGAIGADDVLEADFVWTDDSGHLTSTTVQPVGRGSNGYIYLRPGSPQGNDVISIKVRGQIKWSWHIWITNRGLNSMAVTLDGYTILDRNLGTLNSDLGNKYSLGTYYQWGRKDAFPPAQGRTSNVNEIIYNSSGVISSIPTSTSSEGLQYTVRNPLTFLTTGSNWNGSAGANSWEINGKKTIYDPCPPGWKVAIPAVYASLNTTNFVWNDTSKGRAHATAGWFPASGLRNLSSSNLTSVGAIGAYWVSSYGSPYIQTLDFKNTSVTPNMNYNYMDGASVRCMKE